MKSALISHFEPLDKSELYRTEFRARTKRDDERLLEFAMTLRTLASRAFPKMTSAQRNLLSRDQFVDGLTEDNFYIRVRHAKPKSLEDAVKAALELEAINRSEAKRRTEERAVKSSSSIPGVSFHEQLVTTSGVGSVAAGAAMAAPLFKKWLSASCSLPVTSVVSCDD